jgi:carboxymethylenebutenolidase
VSVLKGEGTVEILFGSTNIPSGSRSLNAYLSRPDREGEWPTVVLLPGAWGVTSPLRDVCRRLSRHGIAVIAPDLYRGDQPASSVAAEDAAVAHARLDPARVHSDLTLVIDFITSRSGLWSNAEDGFGVLGVGPDGPVGSRLAAENSRVAALALLDSPADVELLGGLRVPMLGLSGRDDHSVPVEEVLVTRELVPHLEWVVYRTEAGFWDDHRENYDTEAATDALDRLVAFFTEGLPAVR